MMMSVSCSYAFWVPWQTSHPLETAWNPQEHHICGTKLIVHIDSADSATWNLSLISQTQFWNQLDALMMPFPLTRFQHLNKFIQQKHLDQLNKKSKVLLGFFVLFWQLRGHWGSFWHCKIFLMNQKSLGGIWCRGGLMTASPLPHKLLYGSR